MSLLKPGDYVVVQVNVYSPTISRGDVYCISHIKRAHGAEPEWLELDGGQDGWVFLPDEVRKATDLEAVAFRLAAIKCLT